MDAIEEIRSPLAHVDPTLAGLIESEYDRQQSTLSLIASENTLPHSVLEAVGSIFNSKTVEGFPGRRYHTGSQVVDELEELAVQRACSLFDAEHANVQPHSGVNANLAVYRAVLKPGDVVLSMKLSHGGHLSHGDDASITGQIYQFIHYGVDPDTEVLDYEQIRTLALQNRPRMLIAGGSAYPRLIDYEILRSIADEASCYLMVDMAHFAGLVAAKVIPSPVPFADFVTFTTYKTLMGPHGGVVLCKAEHARQVDRAVFPGTQGTPTLSLVAGKALCFHRATTDYFVQTQRATRENARVLSSNLIRMGYRAVAGATDTHMLLIDLRSQGIKGNAAEEKLERVGILTNRNLIPFDPESPFVTSGLRLGTPSITVRGMREAEAEQIAGMIHSVLSSPDEDVNKEVQEQVADLCRAFPIRN